MEKIFVLKISGSHSYFTDTKIYNDQTFGTFSKKVSFNNENTAKNALHWLQRSNKCYIYNLFSVLEEEKTKYHIVVNFEKFKEIAIRQKISSIEDGQEKDFLKIKILEMLNTCKHIFPCCEEHVNMNNDMIDLSQKNSKKKIRIKMYEVD
jgi:hypothetical protein